MAFSTELNEAAQRWADHLMSIDKLEHSTTKDGENVFTMSSSTTIDLKGPFCTAHASFWLLYSRYVFFLFILELPEIFK